MVRCDSAVVTRAMFGVWTLRATLGLGHQSPREASQMQLSHQEHYNGKPQGEFGGAWCFMGLLDSRLLIGRQPTVTTHHHLYFQINPYT